jgi:hypothetical protein
MAFWQGRWRPSDIQLECDDEDIEPEAWPVARDFCTSDQLAECRDRSAEAHYDQQSLLESIASALEEARCAAPGTAL